MINYALAAGIALLAAACSIGRPMPTVTTYSIEPAPAPSKPSEPTHPERIRVDRVRVVAPYDRSALVYRLSAVRYVSDPYHAFLADPGPMLGDRIAEWLAAAGPFTSVDGPSSAAPTPLVLQITVTELYGDFQADSEPAAVMSVRCELIDQISARPKVMSEWSIARRIPIPNASPDALVHGYGSALEQILSQLAIYLSSAVAQ